MSVGSIGTAPRAKGAATLSFATSKIQGPLPFSKASTISTMTDAAAPAAAAPAAEVNHLYSIRWRAFACLVFWNQEMLTAVPPLFDLSALSDIASIAVNSVL